MTLALDFRKVVGVLGGIVAITSFMTGMILWLGGSLLSPGAKLDLERQERKDADMRFTTTVESIQAIVGTNGKKLSTVQDTVSLIGVRQMLVLCRLFTPTELALIQRGRIPEVACPNFVRPSRQGAQ
jgi:hypothetical protein